MPARADDGVAATTAVPDLAALPIAGITRRRIAILAGAMLAAWIVIAFARQVGEASAATARADDIASANAALRTEVAALERELDLIARQRYIEQQAPGLRPGRPARDRLHARARTRRRCPPTRRARPRSGSAPGATRVAPLERWLTVLFGPSD